MEQSKQWLNQAKLLCAELGPEDGVDPRVLAKKHVEKTKSYKCQQLCKVAKQTLALVITGELSDPLLYSLNVEDVVVSKDGQFFIISISIGNYDLSPCEGEILHKLQAIKGYLRTTIAQSVKRKKVPALKFQVVQHKGVSYAYSKNN